MTDNKIFPEILLKIGIEVDGRGWLCFVEVKAIQIAEREEYSHNCRDVILKETLYLVDDGRLIVHRWEKKNNVVRQLIHKVTLSDLREGKYKILGQEAGIEGLSLDEALEKSELWTE